MRGDIAGRPDVVETAAAVFTEEPAVLSNVVASQTDLHARFGGVVPEVAARAHLQRLLPVIDEALRQASVRLDDIGCIAVHNTPGLVGALLVGVSAAKMLALTLDVPLVGANHIEGHIYACRLAAGRDIFPCVGKGTGAAAQFGNQGTAQSADLLFTNTIYNGAGIAINSVTQNMWILVLTGQVSPKQFNCKSQGATAASTTNSTGQYVSNFNDGAANPANSFQSLSYSIAYAYNDFERLSADRAVQVIYIVLPNGMHEEYVTRGAKTGKHILCEKPMANTSAEAQRRGWEARSGTGNTSGDECGVLAGPLKLARGEVGCSEPE